MADVGKNDSVRVTHSEISYQTETKAKNKRSNHNKAGDGRYCVSLCKLMFMSICMLVNRM